MVFALACYLLSLVLDANKAIRDKGSFPRSLRNIYTWHRIFTGFSQFERSALHSGGVLVKTRCLSSGAGIGKNQREHGPSGYRRALTSDVNTTLMFADYVGCNP